MIYARNRNEGIDMGWVCMRVKSPAVSQIARLRPRPRQELRSAPLNSHSSVTAGTTHISSMLDIMLNPLIGGSSEANGDKQHYAVYAGAD